jgi:prepilin-type N-terminal cleavage/methylation domain-containing protein
VNRRGFSFIELLTVLVVIGTLVRIAVPAVREARRRAVAAQVIADFNAVRLAAIDYHADTGGWPRERATGRVPPELVSGLPRGFTFNRGPYQLDWENWDVRGRSRFRGTGVILGISMVTSDEVLRNAVEGLLGGAVRFTVGNKVTFILQTEGGTF